MVSDGDSDGVRPFHPHQSGRCAPMLHLPTEILQHIFVKSIRSAPQLAIWGLSNPDLTVPFAEPNPAQTPLLLTQVCTLWRAVSISTPDLWCSVRVSIPGHRHYTEKDEPLLQILKSWLCNAQGRPLSIVLDNPGLRLSAIPPSDSLWHYILPLFMSHANHWSTLIASSDMAEYLLERKVHMPMLKTFWSPKIVQYRFADIGCLIPKLSSLSVATMEDRWLSSQAVGVAHTLRHLSLLLCDTALDMLTVLAHFPNLLSFQLRACWDTEPDTSVASTIVHPLEELAIPCTVILPCVRDMLSLPSLRVMIITGMWGVMHMQSVRSMLSRSSCSLQYLEFSGSANNDIDHQIGCEVEQLFAFSPHIRVYHDDFKRPPLSP